jgi:hypothetical protein
MQRNNDEKLPQVAQQNFFNALSPLQPQFFIMPFVPVMKKGLKNTPDTIPEL